MKDQRSVIFLFANNFLDSNLVERHSGTAFGRLLPVEQLSKLPSGSPQ